MSFECVGVGYSLKKQDFVLFFLTIKIGEHYNYIHLSFQRLGIAEMRSWFEGILAEYRKFREKVIGVHSARSKISTVLERVKK
ncbi:MAG: hypothetical protein NTX52_01470 [Planctomycetota bacterium]|nr:hypothetical protein [Planctomycetota bacterium]